MNKFKYRAINSEGKYVKGSIAAENQSDLESFLKSSNLELVWCKSEPQSMLSLIFADRPKTKDIITLFSHLEQLEKAGVSIIEAIADVRDSAESQAVRTVMHEVYESVKNGSLFSEAIAKHPRIFDPVFVGIVSAGEETGNLNDAFTSIIEHLKWSHEMKRKTVKAIRYPAFSLLMMFGVLWVMTTIVVPKVTAFLVDQQIALPLTTRSLIAFSNFVQFKSWLIAICIVVFIVVYKVLYRVPGINVKIDELKPHIPVFGKILVKLDISRFCHFFAMTFKSGIGILDCLESARGAISNLAIKQSIDVVKQQVSDGQSLSKSIGLSGYFPTLVTRMFRVGEESGNMESSLKNVRFFYDQEINDSIDKAIGMIQPTLTIIMGGMMAWITIAVFGPIYATFDKL
jgi:type IV pilus assembly protein PilC